MNNIRQHRPAYFTGFDNETVQFETADQLLAIGFVCNFRTVENFHRFSVALSEFNGALLMAEYNDGKKWWVVGYLKDDVPELPRWVPVR